MIDLGQYQLWFVTGSQHLYGPRVLEQVAGHSQEIASALAGSIQIPVKVVFKPVLTTPEAIHGLCLEANGDKDCVGLIVWMHTFSPAKMWIAGLSALQKPFLHRTGFSQAVTAQHLQDYADIGGIEFLRIDRNTRLDEFKQALRWNETYYLLARGI